MYHIQIGDHRAELPGSWNECTADRLLFALELMFRGRLADLPMAQDPTFQKIEILNQWAAIPSTLWAEWEKDASGEDYLTELGELIRPLSFLFREDGTPSPTLTRAPFPQIKNECRGIKWFCAKDGLSNISFYEMARLFGLWDEYIKNTRDTAPLDRLIAILYRPPKPGTPANKRSGFEGDIRLPLLNHESTIDGRAKAVATLPMAVRRAILFYFRSCREAIITTFENVFTTPDGRAKAGNDYSYAGIMLKLAGGPVDLDRVAAQNHYNVLIYLSMLEDERKAAEFRRATQMATR